MGWVILLLSATFAKIKNELSVSDISISAHTKSFNVFVLFHWALQSKMVQKKSFPLHFEMSDSEWVVYSIDWKQSEPTHTHASGARWNTVFSCCCPSWQWHIFCPLIATASHAGMPPEVERDVSCVFVFICEPHGKSRPCPIYVTLCDYTFSYCSGYPQWLKIQQENVACGWFSVSTAEITSRKKKRWLSKHRAKRITLL